MAVNSYYLLLYALPFALAICHKSFRRKSFFLPLLLNYFIFFAVVFKALSEGFVQTFHGKDMASLLNWPFTPFITELGMANLAFGLTGLFALLTHNYFAKLTLCFAYCLFLLFDFTLDVYSADFPFWGDLAIPFTLLILFYFTWRKE